MNLFLSWSGPVSQSAALALQTFVSQVLPSTTSFLSTKDIPPGEGWWEAIRSQLNHTSLGILCLVPWNTTSPWIHFEAGALAKEVGSARVIPFLLGLRPDALPMPLSSFHSLVYTAAADRNESSLRKLVSTIETVSEQAPSSVTLDLRFGTAWPSLRLAMDMALSEVHRVEKILLLLNGEWDRRLRTYQLASKLGLREEEEGKLIDCLRHMNEDRLIDSDGYGRRAFHSIEVRGLVYALEHGWRPPFLRVR